MRLLLAFALALLATLGGLTPPARLLAQKEFGFDNRKGSGQPYLTPEESVAKFKVAPEFEVKLFAGEPQVVNPVAFTIDEKGRIWVVECFEYPKRTPKGKAPRDRIVILEDTDGDGVCDKRTVFAEGKDFPVPEERQKAGLGAFDLCTGIEVGHGGVFVGAAPYLWFIENKNDKPGKFEVLLKGFGSQDTHETLNTFQWGPDGWLYGLHGIFTNSAVTPGDQLDGPEARINGGIWRYHPTQKKFEVFAEGTSNPWGMDWRNTDGQFILACCVIPHLYHIVPGGVYKRQAGASFNPHVYSYLNEICDHTFHRESGWAHAGLLALDVPHMPEKYRNSVIFGSIHGCSIKQNVLKPNGSTFTASRGDDFLQSGDKNFRPINMKWGPLGDIYLIDWHDQNPCHQTNPDDWDYERGRVYRIQLKGTTPKKAEDLGKLKPADLLKLLADSNPYRYRTALRLFSELDPKQKTLTREEFDQLNLIQLSTRQLWAMYHLGLISKDKVKDWNPESEKAGFAGIPADFAWMIRIVIELDAVTAKTIPGFVRIASEATAPAVRRELASAAIRLADKHDVTPLVRALMARKEDAKDPVIPQLVWIAYEKVLAKTRGADAPRSGDNEAELAWLAEQAPANEFVRDHIVPKVMRRLVATGKADDLRLCVRFLATVKDVPTREKALDGLVVALANQTVDAPAGWAELQAELAKQNDPKLAPLAHKLGVHFRDPAAMKRAYAAVHDLKLSAEHRAEALRHVVLAKHPDAYTLVASLLRQEPDLKVRAEAARQLVAFAEPKIGPDTVKDWKMFPKEIRPDVVNSLASRKEWAKALLQAMADKTIDPTEVTNNVILRIEAFKDKELNALVEKAWGRTRPTPAELIATIDKVRESLHAAPGSFARGKAVFDANCAKCHKFDGRGAEVGPALEGAARDIEYILVNVIDPNRVIGAPYFLRTARLQDGTVAQGVLAEEDDKSITLKVENGVLKKILKADLDGPVQVAEKSIMPEGLGYNMTPQDFRDLVRYLMAHPFLTEVTVNGAKHSAGVPGRIALPDTKGGPVVVEAEIVVEVEVVTTLLVGSSADYELRLNGKAVGTGVGGKQVRPDQDSHEVTLPKGAHRVTVVAKGGSGGTLYVRFLDPDRKVRHPDHGERK